MEERRVEGGVRVKAQKNDECVAGMTDDDAVYYECGCILCVCTRECVVYKDAKNRCSGETMRER